MLEPIEVMALDENMNRASGGIAYRSLIWRRRYYECGTFELYVPKNVYKTTWKYIYTTDRPEMGIIETVCATDDVHAWGGIDTVKVSGRFAESLLSRKVLLPSRVTGYGSTGDNVAVSMRWAEEIFGDRFAYIAPDFDGVERAMAPEPAPYGGILYDELKMAEASYRVLYDFVGNSWTLQPWRGLDRTQSQGGGIVPDPEPDVPDEPTIDELYEPLDYIVATGEQWIDTGVCPNQNTRIVAQVRVPDNPSAHTGIFGTRNSNTQQLWLCRLYNADSPYRFRFGTSSVDSSDIPTSGINTFDANGSTLTVGDTVITATASDFTATYPIYLFAVNNKGEAQYTSVCAFYACQIHDNGTLIRDYVPKRRISDGAVGMLDLVNEVFYPSASGVAFLPPGDLPAGYTRLEYVESTGSQYIDTGVVGQSGTEVEVNWTWVENPDDDTVIGGVSNSQRIYPAHYQSSGGFGYGYGSFVSTGWVATVGQRYSISVKLLAGSQTIAIDGDIVYSAADASEYSSGVNMYVFARNNAGSASHFSKGRCGPLSIKASGLQVRNYVPAKNSGGEAGLFDLVTMAFYADASGTGFVAGPEAAAVAEASTFVLTRTVAASDETTTTVINSFALFSDLFGNIRDYVAIKDASGYKNTCLIDYEYEEPAYWNDDGTPYAEPIYEWIAESSGTARELVGYQIHYNIKRGTITARIADDLPDDEAYLDLTGTKPPYDGEWSRSQYKPDALPDFPTDMRASYAAFPAALEAEGLKHLQANHPMVVEIDTGELSPGGYLKRWDLGDKVDALLFAIGIDMEARITGVDEVYEGATRSVVPIIGEKKHRRL